MAPVLAYWDIRGLAEPARLLLEYTGTKFEDKHYVCGPAPDFDKSCWFDIKSTLGFHFANLPYFIDGDIKVTQSNAIMRYIGRKNDLCGKTETERVRVDIMENQLMDFRNGWVRLCYATFDTQKDAYLKSLDATIKQFADFLGTNKWLAGENLTFPDFIFFELLDQHLLLVGDLLKDHKNLQDYMQHFKDLEPIKAYWASDRYKKLPINNKMAKFGATA